MHGLRNEILNRVQHVTVRKELIPYVLHVILMLMEEKELTRRPMIPVLCRTTMGIGTMIRAQIASCVTQIRMRDRAVSKDKNSAAIATDNGVDGL